MKIKNDETTEVVKEEEVSMAEMLMQFKAMQQELERLKRNSGESVGESIENQKKRYEWSLKASYWIRWEVPVLSIKTVKKDKEMPLTYKNTQGYYVNNHYLDIELADGKVDKMVQRDLFDDGKVRSEKVNFGVVYFDEDGEQVKLNKINAKTLVSINKVEKYTFQHPKYGEILVSNNCIN